MFKTLLVALDGSSCSNHALDLALRLVGAEGSSLALCCVVADASEEERRHAEHIVHKAGERAKAAGILPQSCILEGEPVAQIGEYAKKIAAEAIVLGTHGRSGVRRLLTGSVAEGVLRTAPMPVLTVRAEARLDALAPQAAS